MKHSERGTKCQRCGKRPATVSITWDESDEGEEFPDYWTEDWCDECAKGATDYARTERIGVER